MDRFTNQQLLELVETSSTQQVQPDQFLISIYARMHQSGREVRQNEIRFRKAIDAVQYKLAVKNIDPTLIDERMKAAKKMLADKEFWQHQSEGLAVFISPESTLAYRLPIPFDDQSHVENRFHLTPLLPATFGNQQWYVLAVSPEKVRLLLADPWQAEALQPEALPENLRSALNIDEYVSTLQFHSSSGPEGQAAIHHGQGGSDPDVRKQDEIRQFFHRLDDALGELIDKETRPIVFAGVEYLFPIFCETCKNHQILEDFIPGNPDELSIDSLWKRSKNLVIAQMKQRTERVIDDYQEKLHTPWASEDESLIAKSAAMGQIDQLILATAEDHSRHLPLKTRQSDAVNQIVIDTLANSGNVSLAPLETKSALAAIFRSPVEQYVDQS